MYFTVYLEDYNKLKLEIPQKVDISDFFSFTKMLFLKCAALLILVKMDSIADSMFQMQTTVIYTVLPLYCFCFPNYTKLEVDVIAKLSILEAYLILHQSLKS